MRRQCGLISVTALFLAIFGACSSGPTVDETTPVETTDERRQGASPPAEMVRAPAQIPADTELLWRGSQEQISNLLVRQMNLMRSAMGDQAMRAPERDDGVESTVANLSRELIAGTEINYVDKGLTFPGLKDDEDAFLAIRRLSDQPVLELVDWGAPLVAEDEPSVVFATRIFFPTDDPQALVDAVRDFCGDGDRCKYLLDLSTQEGFAMIDTVRASDFDADEWAVPATQTLDLEVRKTPASQAFLSPLHGVAVYMPSFRFADWAAVARLSRLVAFRAIYQGAPWGQILLEEGGTISRILSMTSPATQEVEDLSVGLRVGETEGIAAALATTHTRVGQQIFEAAEQQIMLPAIDVEEPAIELEWSADFDVAMDTAARPYWLGGTAQTARERWEHYLLDREFWLFAGVLFNQPVGLLKAAAAAFSE